MNRTAVLALSTTLLTGCGGLPDPRTEPLTARQHLMEAEREEAAAEEHAAQYDPDARVTTNEPTIGFVFTRETYNPTDVHVSAAIEHREHAAAHRERAAELRAFEQRECGHFPPATREACPLLLGLTEVEDIEGGVRLKFAPDVDMEPVVEHVRCHVAFAAAEGREGMDHCALYVHGAEVSAEGHTIELTTHESEHVEELRRRTRLQAP